MRISNFYLLVWVIKEWQKIIFHSLIIHYVSGKPVQMNRVHGKRLGSFLSTTQPSWPLQSDLKVISIHHQHENQIKRLLCMDENLVLNKWLSLRTKSHGKYVLGRGYKYKVLPCLWEATITENPLMDHTIVAVSWTSAQTVYMVAWKKYNQNRSTYKVNKLSLSGWKGRMDWKKWCSSQK